MADHPTPGESEAAGKAARRRTPRSALGSLQAGFGIERIPWSMLSLDQDKTRVQGLVPIRHGRMAASAFTFYRGAAAIMAADLAAGPDSGLTAQLCGDAHLSNFGVLRRA